MYAKSPDRPNVGMYIDKVPAGPECLNWLVSKQLSVGISFPKTVIFCRRIKDCSTVYLYFVRSMGPNSSEVGNRLFDMMHSKSSANVKEHIIQSLLDPNALPKVIIATKVLGLGVDAKCECVIHYGRPSSIDDYLQQIGRAGRSGQQSHAVLLYSGQHMMNTETSVIEMLKREDEKCIRKHTLEYF